MAGEVKEAPKRAGPKIGMGVIIPLITGAFLIFSGSLATYSWLQYRQREALEAETTRLAQFIKGQPLPVTAPAGNLKEAQERLEKATNFFPAEIAGSTALQAILKVASASGVQVINLQERPPIRQIVGDNVYYSWPFSLTVEGSWEALLNLVSRLELQEGGPVVLQKVAVNKAKAAYTASLDLAFYTRSRTETVPKTPKPEKGKR